MMSTSEPVSNLVFSGRAGEYFKIWIVNLFLTIVTLSLYYPWAKVRKHRYFYGNTYLNDTSFAYLAEPITLLKGWLIALALLIVYVALSAFAPTAAAILMLLIFLATPWLAVKSIGFKARNSAYRNVRFNFEPAYREAAVALLVMPIFAVITLGLAAPYAVYRQWRFIVNNFSYGTSRFSSTAKVSDFYKIFGKAILFIFALGVVVAIAAFGLYRAFPEYLTSIALGGAVAAMIGYYIVLFAIGVYIYARTQNLAWSAAVLDTQRFASSLRARDLIWIWVSNAIAIAASLGLLIPWAQVRFARYRVEHMAVIGKDFDKFVAAKESGAKAAGQEIGEMFGLNFGL